MGVEPGADGGAGGPGTLLGFETSQPHRFLSLFKGVGGWCGWLFLVPPLSAVRLLSCGGGWWVGCLCVE